MFAGGGASWVEAEMKAGRYAIEAASPGSRPDLTGLSCRWNPIQVSTNRLRRSARVVAIGVGGAAALSSQERHSLLSGDQ